jgi:predicted dehydrogenase
MNFALLGGGDSLLPLLQAISRHEAHTLKAAADVPDSLAAELLQLFPGIRIAADWAELLNTRELAAVVATPGTEPRDYGVRQLASSGTPVILVPDGDPTSSLVLELALVRDDVQVPLVPLYPLRFALPVDALRRVLTRGDAGRVIGLQMNRTLPVAGVPPLLTARQVQQQLIHDADLLRQLGGEYDQVTAVYSGPSHAELSLATVTLAGENRPTATWTIRPTNSRGGNESPREATDSAAEERSGGARVSGFELVVAAEKGSVTIRSEGRADEFPPAGAVSITGSGIDVPSLRSQIEPDVPRAMLESFAAVVAPNSASSSTSPLSPAGGPAWNDVNRAFDVVEAAARSVRRRRTIDLHFEATSERNQFKSQMTAIGCGLMTMTLAAFVFVLMVGGMFELHPTVMKVLRVGIFVPLMLFLLLQLLLFITRPAGSNEPAKPEPPTNETP